MKSGTLPFADEAWRARLPLPAECGEPEKIKKPRTKRSFIDSADY